MWDLGCYPVSFARAIFGYPPTEVFACQETGATDVDVFTVGQLKFKGGQFSQFDCSYCLPYRVGVEVVGETDPALFQEKEEKALYEGMKSIEEPFGQSLRECDYRQSMELLLTLRDPIDNFFDEVLVMEKDERIRQNRLALLDRIAHLFRRLADLSKVVLEGEKE